MRNKFDQQLDQLHVELIRMGSLCEQGISMAAALLSGAAKITAAKVDQVEADIDQKERDIEGLCMKLLLQQQPVARDLRSISAALKMISDMERIGDQAADIADLSPCLAGSTLPGKVHIGDMAAATVKMVTDSVEAFVKSDLALCRAVMAADDGVDAMFDRLKDDLAALIADGGADARAALDLLMAAKYFERIGDHAVNIAEWVEYSITGAHKTDDIGAEG